MGSDDSHARANMPCWATERENTWYIGGLNVWGERTIQVDCSFPSQDKKYTIEIFQDKKRSNKNANLYEHKIMDIDNKNIIEMFMASGGGFAIVIREKRTEGLPLYFFYIGIIYPFFSFIFDSNFEQVREKDFAHFMLFVCCIYITEVG